MILKDFKWLIASCLQKSIRRGRFDLAKKYVCFLWEHDRNYLTYRLGTILTEDVGIANIDLLKEYLSTMLVKVKIDEFGGLSFIENIVQKACDSNKERSSCDSAYLASYYSLKNIENKDLNNIFLNNNEFFINRINAGWIILGDVKYKNNLLNFDLTYPINNKGKKIDDLERFMSIIERFDFSSDLNLIIKNSYLTQIENISLGLPIIQSIFNNEAGQQVGKFKTGDIVSNTYIKEESYYNSLLNLDIISSGIDGHTKEGKTVYYQYLKQNTDFTKYLKASKINFENYFIILSHCMFRLEGHEVNKRLFFPSAVTVMRECEQEILKFKANSKNLKFNDLASILKKDMPLINDIRKEVLLTLENDITKKFKI